jgi:hypothetical protein
MSKPAVNRILLCEFKDGNTVPTDAGTALLYGTSVEELLAVVKPGMKPADLPEGMKRKAHKRVKAARDALGSVAANDVLAWWAVTEWGARIDHDAESGQMWAVLDEGPL